MNLHATLNPMQREAAEHINGSLLILAGAGSGKTRVLTHRIANMVETGISPFNILAITFTNKAAREMRERVDKLCPAGSQVWVSTFHSMCIRILRKNISKLNYDSSFNIYDSDDSERLIRKCVKELNLDDKRYPSKTVASTISNWKDSLLTPKKAYREVEMDHRLAKIAEIYELYQKKLGINNALDFDDIIFKTVELFENNPEILENYCERFKYIMVDEYQDTNTSQYELIRLLSSKHQNLCVVGDDDQSIYGWRGANIRNILEFEKDFKNTKVIKLEQNYRSTKTILDAANAVIHNNNGRKDKTLWSDMEKGEKIKYFKAQNETEEAKFVVKNIEASLKNNQKCSEFAILYRNNALSRSIEEQLIFNNIAYKIFGGMRFYDRKEIKDILAYLRVINNNKDSVSLLRIINVPRRGIGDTTIDKLYNYASSHEAPLFQTLEELSQVPDLGARVKRLDEFKTILDNFIEFSKTHSVTQVINEIIEKTEYLKELKAEQTDEAEGRIENISEFFAKALEFEENREDKSLTSFLEELALVTDLDALSENDDYVSLMTFHSAKGLEFPNIFMIGLEEGLFPSYRAVFSGSIKELEEERRICYVGITRAMKQLYISSATSRRHHGKMVYNAQSRFLKEINNNLMENVIMNNENDKQKVERTGISQYAEINKVKNSIDISFGGKNYLNNAAPKKTKSVKPAFAIGDNVNQIKYGLGVVLDIAPAGDDYEITIDFKDAGTKKFMSNLSKLTKIEK